MASYLGDFEHLKLQQFGSIFTLRASCHRWKRRCTRDAEALRDVAAVMHFIGEIQPAPMWGGPMVTIMILHLLWEGAVV